MEHIRAMNLQLFAGEGAGGGEGAPGAAAGPGEGVNAAAEAEPQQRRRSKAGQFENVVFGIQTQEQPETGDQQPTLPDDGANTEQQPRTSFRDLIRSDEYKAEADEYIQTIVKDRLRGAKEQEALLGKAQATIERIAQRYKMDASDLKSLDFDALNGQIDGDEIYLSERAALNGVTVEVQKQLDEADRIKMTYQRQQQEAETRRAFEAIREQAEAFKQIVPGFDLAEEMRNPVFVQMIRSPQMGGSGLSVEAAYAALHYRDMMGAGMHAAAQQARQSAAATIRAGQQRPAENGSASSTAVQMITDPRKLTKEMRKEIHRLALAGKPPAF